MAYEKHPVFNSPENTQSKIWRYMDISKFLNILDKNSLFFSRADLLGDPFEGSYTKRNIEKREAYMQNAKESDKKAIAQFAELKKALRNYTYVNCWHLNEYESDAMWKLYIRTGEGIAIQSTFERYVKSMVDARYDIYVGLVKYIDYDRDLIPEDNGFNPYVYKKLAFEHEKELRGVIVHTETADGKAGDILPPESGINTIIDIKTLIEKIYVAPTSPEWIFQLTKSMVRRFGLDIEVVRSNLEQEPYF